MYMTQTGGFASSTFYMPKHPAWVDAFNAAKPSDRYFKDRVDADARRVCLRRVAARQPALVRPSAGQAADDDGRADEKPGPRSTTACCAARTSTSCRSPSRAPRSPASSSARTTFPTS
jgi:hypothetical protein